VSIFNAFEQHLLVDLCDFMSVWQISTLRKWIKRSKQIKTSETKEGLS
jgi:hypothetical protein